MASIDQVIEQVAFGLEQLGVRNAHHEFEHMCRHFARARICSNILPATGPVSAGGDQGRDFETFRSYLASSSLGSSSFISRVTDKPLAFACTLQRNSLESKIKSDVSTILASGTPVVGIHYFCGTALVASKRHELQEWARSTYSVELEIYDARALSENLSSSDTFWIAARYLGIPSEIYPRSSLSSDECYEEQRLLWQNTTLDPTSFSQFHEIKILLRYAVYEDSCKHDVPLWIARIEKFCLEGSTRPLFRKAKYEVAVARLRGLGTLNGSEEELRKYFNQTPDKDEIDEIEDYVILLSFCLSATKFGHAELSFSELRGWQQAIIGLVDEAIQARTFPSTQAVLFRIRGYAAIQRVENDLIISQIDEPLEYWHKAADLLPSSPLFPLETFADCLTAVCGLVGNRARFRELTAKVDEALEKRIGGFAAAEKCRDRAMAHHDQGRMLDAITEIHRAKLKWFAEETLPGFVLAMMLLSQSYGELGLCMAGKYHALAAASIAFRSANPEVKAMTWRALMEAGSRDYEMGAWAGFLDQTTLALKSHGKFAFYPGDMEKHPDLEKALFHVCVALAVTERLCPQFHILVKEFAAKWFPPDLLNPLLARVRESLGTSTEEELVAKLEEQLCGCPVSDVKVNRSIEWSALGVVWRVEWLNDYRSTTFAEQFVACFQIIQGELARTDLCLPRTRVSLTFRLYSQSEPRIVPSVCDDELQWIVEWPNSMDDIDLQMIFSHILVAAIDVFAKVSFLPSSRMMAVIERLFQDGIQAKACVGLPYGNLYCDVVTENEFNHSRSLLALPSDMNRSAPPRPHSELSGFVGQAPDYDVEKSHEQIRHRYERILNLLPVTLSRLRASNDFHQTVVSLRGKGWRDWHILGAILTATFNFRMKECHGDDAPFDVYESFQKEFMATPEQGNVSMIPMDEFSEEHLEWNRRLNLGAMLITWGLELHHPTMTFQLIEDFLATRYGYWRDDVPHEDPFVL